MLTSLLFVLYVGLAVVGYFLWRTALAESRLNLNGERAAKLLG